MSLTCARERELHDILETVCVQRVLALIFIKSGAVLEQG
jgi:hypothetical protein